MAGKRIPDLDPLSGAASANDDKFVVYDVDAGTTKRMDRSQVAEGMVGDLPLQYYLGVLNSAPSTRLNGDALQLGDYYLDSATKYTTVYNGSGWNSYASVIAAQAAAEAARDAAQLAETNAETAETNAETAETGAVAARLAAELAQAGAESARDLALVYGSATIYATWTELAAATGMAAGDVAQVVSSDTGTHTDPVVSGTVANSGVFQYSASPAGWERIADLESDVAQGFRDEAEGFADDAAASATTAAANVADALETMHYGSAQFPEENGEAPDAQDQGFFTLPNSNTALTGSGSNAFWFGDSSLLIFYDCPVDRYRGLNRNPIICGTDPLLSARGWFLSYLAKGRFSNPTTHRITFGVRGESGTSAAWTCDTGDLIPLTVQRMAIMVVRSGDNMNLQVQDLATGTWYVGTTVAKPAGFVGAPLLTHPIAIGISGIRSTPFPSDWTATTGVFTPQAMPHLRGALRDLVIADKVLTQADAEAIANGADPVTQVSSGSTRLHAPLVANGRISLAVTSNRPALTNGLTQFGVIHPGPTLRWQSAGTYLVLNPLRWPGFIAREHGTSVAVAQLTGKTAGLTGPLQVRIVDRTRRVVRDWHGVDYTLTGTDLAFSVNVPCPMPHRFEIQARFANDTTIVASTHSDLQAGPVVALWGQSEGVLSTIGGISNTGANSTLNVRPEGDTGTINFIMTDGIVRATRLRPGLLGDCAINIANYIRRRTSEPVLFACHLISGTSLRDLMDDTITGRQWAAEEAAHAFPINRGPSGEFVITGHVKIGWEAADNVINYSEVVNAPWYQGRGWNGAALVGINQVDHFLYDGSMSMSAVSVELPCNRVVSVNTNTTDLATEADQRDSQRNWGHLLGYRIGPPQCTHKMEGENAAGGIGGTWTHPEGNDWEGALEMSYANAEAAMIAIGEGEYQGAVFFESIRAGSAANKVIVTLGNPRPFPGEGLVSPNTGYATTYQRAPAPSGLKLRTKKAGGNVKWGFEARINNAGSYSLNNVTAAAIINAREVELTLSANYVPGETRIVYQPGSPGNYGSATVTQENWRSGQLFFSGTAFAAGKEPGWAVSGSNQPLTLPA